MRKINNFFLTIHRILGTLLSVVFLMWFLTGMVMLFHGSFPSADKTTKLDLLSQTEEEFPALDSLTRGESFTHMNLSRYIGRTTFEFSTADSVFVCTPAGVRVSQKIKAEELDKICQRWCAAPVAQCDTLHDLNQWVPFGSYREELPILKYTFQDAEKHHLYVGSSTGHVLQFTTREQRVWAWLGPIPHWIYFTWLRSDRDLWMQTVSWMSGIGCLMVLSGMWTGVTVWIRTRKKQQKKFSPYKKKWYHWHYVTGVVFGLFCLSYCFSGMMSLVKLPPAFISHATLDFDPKKTIDDTAAQLYMLDYRKVLESQPEAVQLTWNHLGRIPFYTVLRKDGSTVNYDARSTSLKELNLSENEITEVVKDAYLQHGIEIDSKAETQNHQELYYSRVKGTGKDVLPVVKVSVNDADNGVFYINPSNGSVRYVDTTGRWSYWLYRGLHKLRVPGIMEFEWLRIFLSLLILAGGTAVSASGVVLGCRYLFRKFKH